jgi:hypothetical protein
VPTKISATNTDDTEDASSQPGKKKMQRVIFPTTRRQNRLKRHALRPDKHDVSPLLADNASAKTSKSAASLQPISLGYNNNKSKTKQSQLGDRKGKRQI